MNMLRYSPIESQKVLVNYYVIMPFHRLSIFGDPVPSALICVSKHGQTVSNSHVKGSTRRFYVFIVIVLENP